ncbi:MAG TPA: DUF4282 domain-containing protein [Alphaproteobacteria bacterium]|nr:DUF4282 domain-containing protein [Alphaproteobacteria bacterium]
MTGDDLRKIFLGTTLFRLDTILSPRLVPILYATGLAALLLWAVIHLFATFGRNFGDGLWGLLEIAVFGLLGLVALRIVCEVLLVFFKVHETAAKTVSLSRISTSLLDEVREAISDIADEEDAAAASDLPPEPPATPPVVRRTARRSPPPPARPDE